MITAIKAEFRKIFTIRSTWVIFGISFLLGVLLIGFWIYGYQDVGTASAQSSAMLDSMLTAVGVSGLVLSFVMLLLVGHEYRYNTITYSLTSSASRSKVFFAKFIAGTLAVLAFGAIIVLLNGLLFTIGQGMNDKASIAQSVPILDFMWRAVATFIGYAAFAFIAGVLLRNLIASVAVMLLLPSTVEGLLSLLLKSNVKYLPFTALSNISIMGAKPDPVVSLGIVGAYIAVLGFIAWIMFVRRDAN